MTNEEGRDQVGKPDSTTGVNKDEKGAANPTRPQPIGQEKPNTETIEAVKTDAVIEDRFEATDN